MNSSADAHIGRYRVSGTVSFGSFAEVVRGEDEVLGVPVAIKVLHRHLALDVESRERFTQEARLLRRVTGPHLLAVHDIGQLADGRPYFVTDLATGGTLAGRIEAGARIDLESLRRVVEALHSGLGSLHRAGIVHRDVSPANLLVFDCAPAVPGAPLVPPEGRAVLGDLGLALDLGRSALTPTSPAGTPRYRSPEQERHGERIDGRADLYGATAVLWWLLAGTEPPADGRVSVGLRTMPLAWRSLLASGLQVDPERRPASAAAWAAIAREALGSGDRGLRRPHEWPADRCPFLGLARFDEADHAVFFGRDALIELLVARLGEHGSVLVGGASGVGKSSLLRAGLVPQVKAGGLGGDRRDTHVADARDLDVAALHVLDPATDVVVVDQFEQVLVGPDAASIVTALHAAAERGVGVVVGLRSDFYPAAAMHPWLAELIGRHLFLAAPDQAQLRELIEGPAAMAGVAIDAELVDTALADAARGPGMTLPLLAHALALAWEQRDGDRLTVEAYRARGGLAGAVAMSGERVLTGREGHDLERIRTLLLRMVAVTPAGPATGRRLALEGLHPEDRVLVDALAASRVISVDGDGCQLAHESVIESWPTLRRWVDRHRGALLVRHEVERAAERWRDSGRGDELLLRGARLAVAVDWTAAEPAAVEPAIADFVGRSVAIERRRGRRRRLLLIGAAVLTATAVVASMLALAGFRTARHQAGRAGVEARRNLARRLAADAVGAGLKLDLATLLAAEAYRLAPTEASVLAALGAVEEPVEGRFRFDVSLGDRGVFAGFAEQGALLLAASDDGHVVATDTATGDIVSQYHDPSPISAAATGDDLLAVVGVGDAIRLYRPRTLAAGPFAVVHHRSAAAVSAVEIAPDGTTVVSAGADGSAIVWHLDGAEPTVVVAGSAAWHAELSPDAALLAVASDRGPALHRIEDGAVLPLEAAPGVSTATAWRVRFSADGSRLAAGGAAGAAVWDVRSGALLRVSHDQCHCDVWDVDLSPDGTKVATGGDDAFLRVVEVDSGTPLASVLNENRVTDVEFDPEGESVVAATKADRAILIRASNGGLFTTIDHRDWVWRAVFSPDGRTIATASSDGTVRLSDTDSFPTEGLLQRAGSPAPLMGVGVGPFLAFVDAERRLSVVSPGDGLGGGAIVGRTQLSGSVVAMTATGPDGLALAFDDGFVVHGRLGPDGSWQETGRVSLEEKAIRLAAGDGSTAIALTTAGLVVIERGGAVLARYEQPGVLAAFPAGADAIVAVSADGRVVQHRLDGSTELVRVEHIGEVYTSVRAADGRLAIGGSAGAVVFDDAARPAVRRVFEADVGALAFVDREGVSILLTGGVDGRAAAIDLATGRVLWDVIDGDFIDHIAVPQDGSYAAFTPHGHDRGITLRDPVTGTLLGVRAGADGSAPLFAPSVDGQWILTGFRLGQLLLWPMPPRWPGLACARARRSLSAEEWRRHIGGEPPADLACDRDGGLGG